MKILIASFTFPPNVDGVSEAASAMADAFRKRGWHVEIATEPTDPPRDISSGSRETVHEFAFQDGLGRLRPLSEEIERFRLFLLSGNWDIIVFHSYVWFIDLAIPLLDLIPSRKILVSHGYGALIWVPVPKFPYGLGYLLRSAMDSLKMLRWLRKVDRLVILSHRRDLLAFFDHTLACLARHKGIRIIPNGIDLTETSKNPHIFRDAVGANDKTVVFLCVANYSKRKDQGFAARAFRVADVPNSLLVFVGSNFNEFSEQFQRDDAPFASRSQGRIVWMERQNRTATLNAIGGCDVFVLSASHEAQPFVLLEAMREKKPWIARNAGCISELPGGLAVGSEAAMAKEMRSLAQNAKERDRLASEGRKAVETIYNREAYVQSYCQLVEELVS